MRYAVRLCTVVMFHVQWIQPPTCIVMEGFGALEMLLLFIILLLLSYCFCTDLRYPVIEKGKNTLCHNKLHLSGKDTSCQTYACI